MGDLQAKLTHLFEVLYSDFLPQMRSDPAILKENKNPGPVLH